MSVPSVAAKGCGPDLSLMGSRMAALDPIAFRHPAPPNASHHHASGMIHPPTSPYDEALPEISGSRHWDATKNHNSKISLVNLITASCSEMAPRECWRTPEHSKHSTPDDNQREVLLQTMRLEKMNLQESSQKQANMTWSDLLGQWKTQPQEDGRVESSDEMHPGSTVQMSAFSADSEDSSSEGAAITELKQKKTKKRKKRQLKSSKSKALARKSSKSGRPKTGRSNAHSFKYTSNASPEEALKLVTPIQALLNESGSFPMMRGKCVQLQVLPTPPKGQKPEVRLSLHSRSHKGIKMKVLEVKSSMTDSKNHQRVLNKDPSKDGSLKFSEEANLCKTGTKSLSPIEGNGIHCKNSAKIASPRPDGSNFSRSQSHVPIDVTFSKNGTAMDSGGRSAYRVVKIYQSEKQSGTLKEMGLEVPCAPPATPLPDTCVLCEYVPSMSDCRAQRAVKVRLEALEKVHKQRQAKLREDREKKEKQQQHEKERSLRRQRRREIYALNKVMTELEHKNFKQFCEDVGLNTKS